MFYVNYALILFSHDFHSNPHTKTEAIHKIEGGLATYLFRANNEGQIVSIASKHGGILTLEYTDGHISQVSGVMGNVVTFDYDGDYLNSYNRTLDRNAALTHNICCSYIYSLFLILSIFVKHLKR